MEKRLAEIRDESQNKKEIFTTKGAKKPLKKTLAPARGAPTGGFKPGQGFCVESRQIFAYILSL